MLLAYLDESYDQRRYWIASVVIPDSAVQPLTHALDAVVRSAAAAFGGISPRAELHGHALFHGKDDWSALHRMPRARIGVYRNAMSELARHDLRVLIRGVDCAGLSARYSAPDPPHAVVLMHLLERIDEHAAHSWENVIVIADEIPEANRYRRDLWYFQRVATSGYRSRRLASIIDTIHFAPSTSSRLLQAADLVAYLWFRIDSGADHDARAQRVNADLWRLISAKVIHNRLWSP